VLRDKAAAAPLQQLCLDLWLDQRLASETAADSSNLVHLDRSPRAVRVSLRFKTDEEAAAAALKGETRAAVHALLGQQLFWVNQWYHSRIEILSLVFRPLPPPRYSGSRRSKFLLSSDPRFPFVLLAVCPDPDPVTLNSKKCQQNSFVKGAIRRKLTVVKRHK